jgi:hypothetical protein
MTMGFRLDEAVSLWGMVLNHVTLSNRFAMCPYLNQLRIIVKAEDVAFHIFQQSNVHTSPQEYLFAAQGRYLKVNFNR